MDKLEFLTQSTKLLAELVQELQDQINNAQEGIKDDSSSLIIGSLYGVGDIAHHIESVYNTMVFISRHK